MLKILHNPRCRKSRETLQLIKDLNIEVEEILYLDNPPGVEELRSILQQLNMQAEDLVRKGENLYKEQFKGKDFTEEKWIEILASNPILIERPVVFNGKKAVIGRPPENVLKLI
jgi:arsenate reductase (glutaredoxin)